MIWIICRIFVVVAVGQVLVESVVDNLFPSVLVVNMLVFLLIR